MLRSLRQHICSVVIPHNLRNHINSSESGSSSIIKPVKDKILFLTDNSNKNLRLPNQEDVKSKTTSLNSTLSGC